MCSLCGERGHNRRTCGKPGFKETEEIDRGESPGCDKIRDPQLRCQETRITYQHRCRSCSKFGHNSRTCPQLIASKQSISSDSECKRLYTCTYCRRKGHNIRTCPNKQKHLWLCLSFCTAHFVCSVWLLCSNFELRRLPLKTKSIYFIHTLSLTGSSSEPIVYTSQGIHHNIMWKLKNSNTLLPWLRTNHPKKRKIPS